MAIVAVSIAPAASDTSVSLYVAEAIRVLEAQEAVRWELSSMFTTLEGDLDDIFSLIRAMQEAVFAKGAVRVATVIKIDDRRDKNATMAGKVASVRTSLDEH